ncbi:MAG: hypothetical protein ACNA74_08790, partial [Desulfurivibrio sp.]
MSRSRYYNGFPRYVPVAEKEAKAAAGLERLRKSRPDLQPVILPGKTLARTWWGKGWNSNLERYADYSNRIGRGRAYLRHGAVLDLVIEAGEIRSLVQGSRRKPYEVVVAIKPIKAGRWAALKKQCRGMIEALPDLLAGRFPAELAGIFMAPGSGLFPAPAEIGFHCSCPDWASMCKHVAATLYGIGARLDEEPALFFKLRQVEMAELISGAIEESSSRLLARSARKSHRVMEGGDLGELFGIELAEPVAPPAASPAAAPNRETAPPPPAKSKSSKTAKATRRSPAASPRTRAVKSVGKPTAKATTKATGKL